MPNISLTPLTFPLWWYTTGVSEASTWVKHQTRFGLQDSGLLVFARHMKEPLFGDYTKTGIFVGFCIRCTLLVVKLLWFGIREIVVCLLFLLFLAILPIAALMLVRQLIPV
jgi:hypothetical protein